tara:strand:+ start:734 stop:925 length:192 start_codon:yes stop_codon:yes gene_type:complete
MMTLKETIKILNVSDRTFRAEHKKQKFPFVTSLGQNLFIHEKAFYKWLDNGNTKETNNNEREN